MSLVTCMRMLPCAPLYFKNWDKEQNESVSALYIGCFSWVLAWIAWLHGRNKVAHSSEKKLATFLYISRHAGNYHRTFNKKPVLANLVVILHSCHILKSSPVKPHLYRIYITFPVRMPETMKICFKNTMTANITAFKSFELDVHY